MSARCYLVDMVLGSFISFISMHDDYDKVMFVFEASARKHQNCWLSVVEYKHVEFETGQILFIFGSIHFISRGVRRFLNE